MAPAPVGRVRAGLLLDVGATVPTRRVDVVLHGDRVAAVEPWSGGAPDVGGADALVLPALADAHDHGRGLPTVAFGAADQALETWLPALALQPWIDPGLLTRLALCKLARSGVGAVVHCHNTQRAADLVAECVSSARAASEVGVRLGLAVPLADRNRLGYGPDEDVLAHVDERARAAVRSRWQSVPLPPADQLALVDEVAAAVASLEAPLVQVQYGPIGPQWCSDELLAAVADASERTGRRVHMHLCETRYQREWADAAHPGRLLRHLDRLGLLTDRLTVAHAVWLDDDDLSLLAERRVVVSVNTSSNLRLRSGTARLARMVALGVRVGTGMDGMSLDDDEDALRELQLTHLLHAGVGLDRGVSAATVLLNATHHGPVAAAGDAAWGCVAPGAPADVVVLDGAPLTRDVVDDAVATTADVAALVLARARGRHVRDLVVAGRHVVAGGAVVGVDETAVAAEVAASCRAAAPRLSELRPIVTAFQDGLERFYASGAHRGVARPAGAPTGRGAG